MPSNQIKAIEMIGFDAATLTNNYQVINPNGLPNACSILYIVNSSNVGVAVSYDNDTDNDFILANNQREINAQANALFNNREQMFPVGTRVSVRSPTTGTGIIWLVGYYS